MAVKTSQNERQYVRVCVYVCVCVLRVLFYRVVFSLLFCTKRFLAHIVLTDRVRSLPFR